MLSGFTFWCCFSFGVDAFVEEQHGRCEPEIDSNDRMGRWSSPILDRTQEARNVALSALGFDDLFRAPDRLQLCARGERELAQALSHLAFYHNGHVDDPHSAILQPHHGHGRVSLTTQ